MDINQMRTILAAAPKTPSAKSGFSLSLPMPGGLFQSFQIAESPVMHPDLAAKFPNIKTYSGWNAEGSYTRFDITEHGFHAVIYTKSGETLLIDPTTSGADTDYFLYNKKDNPKPNEFTCLADDIQQSKPEITSQKLLSGDCQYRTYDLALACTGEYAQFHGGTTTLAMSAMVTTINRVNSVFERDLSVHLTLVANNNQLIFLNGATDPYTNNDGYAMIVENQTTVDAIIGNANYDIGHVFSTGGGGLAYTPCVCDAGYKAGGVTGLSAPIGDGFDIDFVAHEMGHQFGANHTMNNDCNRNDPTAFEPGSGTTIMGYAGVCPPNVLPHSHDNFHLASLIEIRNFIAFFGTTCAITTNVNNSPTAEAGSDYIIPKSTPFILTGTGTDAEDANLTYCWEQYDNQVAPQPPVSTNSVGPMFRAFSPIASTQRYCPMLSTVLANATSTWEVLPSVARTLKFRLTVRDNHVGGGCWAADSMRITVNGTAGPFLVTSQTTLDTLTGGSQEIITWNVAGTTASPISCTNVDILLSLDGGLTWTVFLATNTANDGTEAVTIPNQDVTNARIMVRCSNNIFYDVNNSNFRIMASADPCAGTPTYEICPGESYVLIADASATTVQWYKDGMAISGATNLTYTATMAGEYYYTGTNVDGCAIEQCCRTTIVVGTCPVICKPDICLPIKIQMN